MGMITTWAGECSAWECDDLGHLNMRHYMTKIQQARQMMIIELGLDEAFKMDSVSSVRVEDYHIKYLGEARPGDPLWIETGILALHEDTMVLCHMMRHLNGKMACTVVENIAHISLRTRKSFGWANRTRQAAKAFMCERPNPTKPRGFSDNLGSIAPPAATLQKWGMTRVGMGVFQPFEMGLHGHITPQALKGRITETIAFVTEGWPDLHEAEARARGDTGALLEARIFLHRRAEPGDAYHMYSGVQSATSHTRSIIHHLVDVVTGENLFSMLAIGCKFNMKTRKLIQTGDAQLAELEKVAIKDLAL